MYALSNLNKLAHVGELVPETMQAFKAYDKAALADGAIPKKYRELIAIAVSCTTQCPYCLEAHAKAAQAAGASREEVVEASLIAAALRAGGSATHGTMALKFFDKQAEPKKA